MWVWTFHKISAVCGNPSSTSISYKSPTLLFALVCQFFKTSSAGFINRCWKKLIVEGSNPTRSARSFHLWSSEMQPKCQIAKITHKPFKKWYNYIWEVLPMGLNNNMVPKNFLFAISMWLAGLGPVMRSHDSAIHRINPYPVDKIYTKSIQWITFIWWITLSRLRTTGPRAWNNGAGYV